MAVEAAWAQESWIEHVGAVGGGDNDDALLGIEAIHLDEELVECLFAFVVTAAHAVSAVAADGVDFIDEHEAGGGFFALLEHVANARGADADEHFHEVRAADREKRNIRLAGDGSGEERLAGARRADHEDAFRDAAAEFLEFLRVFEELDEFLDLVLRLLDTGHVLEGDAVFILREHAGLRLAEVQRALARHFDLRAEEEVEDDQKENDRQEADQGRGEEVGFRADGRGDARFAEGLLNFRAVELGEDRCAEGHWGFLAGGRGGELGLALEILGVAALLDDELEGRLGGREDFALFDHLQEFRVLDLFDLGEIVSTEEERATDESEGDGEENEAAPVQLRVLSTVLALAVVV